VRKLPSIVKFILAAVIIIFLAVAFTGILIITGIAGAGYYL